MLFVEFRFISHPYPLWKKNLKGFTLYNMNGRMYDPAVGRFLNVDPLLQDPGNTQSYNRYSYCLNNPLKYADPSGYKLMNITCLGDFNVIDADGLRMSSKGSGGIGKNSWAVGPGVGKNGTGLNGSYYDWYTGTYRSTNPGNSEESWDEVYYNISTSVDSYSTEYMGRHDRVYENAYRPNPNGKIHLYAILADIRISKSQGGSRNNNFEQLDKYSNYISLTGMGMEAMSYASISSANYTPMYAYRGMAQPEAAAAKFLGKMAKVTKHAGTFANVLTTAYSGYKVVDQYTTGGVKNIDGWDLTDATVGGVGLYASYAVSAGIASGPIGWGTIAVGATIYGIGRLGYELYNEP